eukprot:2848211-Rhodomonas_salina.1
MEMVREIMLESREATKEMTTSITTSMSTMTEVVTRAQTEQFTQLFGELKAMLEDTTLLLTAGTRAERERSEEIREFGGMERRKENFYLNFFEQLLWTEEELDLLPADFNAGMMRKAKRELLERLDKLKVLLVHPLMDYETRRWEPFGAGVEEQMDEAEREVYVGTVCMTAPWTVGTQAIDIILELFEEEVIELDFQPHSVKNQWTAGKQPLPQGQWAALRESNEPDTRKKQDWDWRGGGGDQGDGEQTVQQERVHEGNELVNQDEKGGALE